MLQAQCESLYYTLNSMSQGILGRPPSQREMAILRSLGNELSTKFNDQQHEDYLKRLYKASGRYGDYVRYGRVWKSLGFQSEDPARDIRGGGILTLTNMLYFLDTHPAIANYIIVSRSKADITESGILESYPFAVAGSNLTNLIAQEFDIVAPSGKLNTSYGYKSYWSMLKQPNGFHRIYVLAFLLLEHSWQEQNAHYMQFNAILTQVKTLLHNLLVTSKDLVSLERRVFALCHFCRLQEYSMLPEAEEDLYISNDTMYTVPTVPYSEFMNGTDYSCSDKRSVIGIATSVRRRQPFTLEDIFA